MSSPLSWESSQSLEPLSLPGSLQAWDREVNDPSRSLWGHLRFSGNARVTTGPACTLRVEGLRSAHLSFLRTFTSELRVGFLFSFKISEHLSLLAGITHANNRIWPPKIWNVSWICLSSLHKGHANLLCIILILVQVLLKREQGGECFKA